MTRHKIGLVLGSGSARGWAHIGVIRALEEEGVVPDIICGCSIGAFVGAAYAGGDLDRIEAWARRLTWQKVVSMLDVSWGSGLIKGERLIRFLCHLAPDREFKDLGRPFAAVATDLETGREVWLREGNVARAVRASIALPGVFTPVAHESGFYVDGALVNPVPVSLARAMEADIIVAVELGSALVGRSVRQRAPAAEDAAEAGNAHKRRLLSRLWAGKENQDFTHITPPSMVNVMTSSLNIMQVRIARSRLAGEPADVLISPRLAQLGLMDYHRAEEAIAEGRAAVRRILPSLQHALDL